MSKITDWTVRMGDEGPINWRVICRHSNLYALVDGEGNDLMEIEAPWPDSLDKVAAAHNTDLRNRAFNKAESDRWFRALQREMDGCKSQRDRLLEACKLVMDYEAIHLNGGIGYCIAIKTSALNAISELVREAEAFPTPEITDNLP